MSTYGKDRMKIYEYLQAQGLEFTEQQHEQLKQLLIEYVNPQTVNLKADSDAYRKHQVQCELYAARRQARKDRQRSARPKVITKI